MTMSNKAPTFADFWQAYPLHVSKKRAEGAWNRLTAKEKRLAIAAIPAYVAYIQTMPAPSYKTPQGWLNDRRWEDELTEVTDPTPAPPLQGRGVPCGQNATKKEQFKFHVSMLGQMNVRGKADGIANPAERPAFPDGMDKW
jgi:hypothetical protein